MIETWYVLDNGSVANPSEVSPDKDGVLRHKSGQAVAMRNAETPMTRSIDTDEHAEKPKPAAANREMKAGAAKSYKTR